MELDVAFLNELPANKVTEELLKCCGSRQWAQQMVASRPFADFAALSQKAAKIWNALDSEDWLEAFRSHPRIGEQKSATPQDATAKAWSQQEQSGVQDVGTGTAQQLAELNQRYEDRFGFIYIVCATGKSAEELLDLLCNRLQNDPAQELRVAAAEQAKITDLRLRKLLSK